MRTVTRHTSLGKKQKVTNGTQPQHDHRGGKRSKRKVRSQANDRLSRLRPHNKHTKKDIKKNQKKQHWGKEGGIKNIRMTLLIL